MTEVIKVRCNGPNSHVNEVDLDDALREQPIARQVTITSVEVPERIILRCRSCSDGKVILTRSMIERARRKSSS